MLELVREIHPMSHDKFTEKLFEILHETTQSACLKSFGERAFSIAGTKAWNILPLELRRISEIKQFKAKLKHYLFNMSNSFYSSLILV